MAHECSETKPNDTENRSSQQSLCDEIIYDLYSNEAIFFPEDKRFVINVDCAWEERDIVDFMNGNTTPPDFVQDSEEEPDGQKKWFDYFMNKFDISSVGRMDPIVPEYPWPDTINVLNGAVINLKYGEGLLDFIYADFITSSKELLKTERFIHQLASAICDNDHKSAPHDQEVDSMQNSNVSDDIRDDDEDFCETFSTIDAIAYCSLYSAICPPLFRNAHLFSEEQRIVMYGNHLIALQKQYLEMIEFCYDEDFYPDVLGKLHPSQRLRLYRIANKLPTTYLRKDQLKITRKVMMETSPDQIMIVSSIAPRSSKNMNELTEEEKLFAKTFGISETVLLTDLRFPCGMVISYNFRSVADILELEFTKMLEADIRFRKCKRCGKYFIMKGNYDTNYCDRIAEGEARTCQELAAIENYKARIAGNKAIPIYNKYYKRYAARVKVNQIKESDFKKWKYQALQKRDECSAGTISPEEYTEWMESAFPNRKAKNRE